MKTHIFVHAENYSAAQTQANNYEAQGLPLVDWHPSPRGGLVLHFVKTAKPAPKRTQRTQS